MLSRGRTARLLSPVGQRRGMRCQGRHGGAGSRWETRRRGMDPMRVSRAMSDHSPHLRVAELSTPRSPNCTLPMHMCSRANDSCDAVLARHVARRAAGLPLRHFCISRRDTTPLPCHARLPRKVMLDSRGQSLLSRRAGRSEASSTPSSRYLLYYRGDTRVHRLRLPRH